MIAVAYYLIKVFICSAILLIYYHLALRNKLFHQWNRYYLLLTVVLSLLIPCFKFTLFSFPQPGRPIQLLQVVYTADEYVASASSKNHFTLSLEQTYYLIYLLVSLTLFILFLISIFKIRKLIRSHSVQSLNTIKFVNTEVRGTPFSFFNFIFWNRSIDIHSATGQQIFQHELVHVQEKHSVDKIFMQIVLSVFWYNPIFWLVRNELKMIHEFIADKKAVGQADTSAFAAMILQAAYPQHSFINITNQFFQSSIKRRLTMLAKQKKSKISYAGRILALPLIAFLAFAFTIKAKDVTTNDSASIERYHAVKNAGETKIEDAGLSNTTNQFIAVQSTRLQKKDTTENPLVYIDGVKKGRLKELGGLDKLVPVNQVKAMYVYKGKEAIEKYGKNGTDGVIELITKNAPPPPPPPAPPSGLTIKSSGVDNPLIFIEGKEKGRLKDGIMKELPPDKIESINVLKGEAAEKKYGEKGKQGVIEITLKKDQQRKENESGSSTQGKPIFEKAEYPPQFPGGLQAWRRYLERNLNARIPSDKGAPTGNYTVIAQFIVNEDGTVSDVKATTNHGYGMEEEVIRLIERGPKWVPAIQNRHKVTSYKKQPVTFVLAKG